MHPRSTSIKFRPYRDANDVTDKLFKSLCLRCQENIEESMRGSDVILNSVQLMYSNVVE